MMRFLKKRVAGTIPALFLHIQKTAGTSLVKTARKYYGKNIASHGDFCETPPEKIEEYNFISGHFGYAYASQFMEGRYSFTFLRDPVERVLSFYYFCRSRKKILYDIYRLAQTHELPEFLEICLTDPSLKVQVWNNQVWQLAYGYTYRDSKELNEFSLPELLELAKEHLESFSHVGFTESFASDAAVIREALGFPKKARFLFENVTPSRPTAKDLPESTLRMVEDFTELDRELYNYARSRAVNAKLKSFL